MRVNGAECRMITRVAESLSALFAEAGIRRVFVESGLTPRGIRRPQTGHTRGRLARGG